MTISMSPHSYLITGGCGLQGSNIVEALLPTLSTGSTITVLARNPTTNIFPGVSYQECDITHQHSVRSVFTIAKPDVIFHCAGVMTAVRRPIPDEVVRSINVDGTRILIQEAQKIGVKAFIFTSSASVVQKAWGLRLRAVDETWPMVEESDGMGIYPTSKAEAERMVLAANEERRGGGGGGMVTVGLRPAVIYGERDNDTIPSVMASLRGGRGKMQIGSGDNLFSFTYVENSTRAHLLALEKLMSPDAKTVALVAGEAFFITNEEKVPFSDFGRAVFKAAGTEIKREEVFKVPVLVAVAIAWVLEWVAWMKGSRPSLTVHTARMMGTDRYFEIGKARQRLGYKPLVPWDEGVKRGVKWFLENEKKQSESSAY